MGTDTNYNITFVTRELSPYKISSGNAYILSNLARLLFAENHTVNIIAPMSFAPALAAQGALPRPVKDFPLWIWNKEERFRLYLQAFTPTRNVLDHNQSPLYTLTPIPYDPDQNKINFYLIESEHYNKEDPYSYAAFCKAAAEVLADRTFGKGPQVVVLNDHPTSLVAPLLAHNPKWYLGGGSIIQMIDDIGTEHTAAQRQGICDLNLVDFLDLPQSLKAPCRTESLEYNGKANPLKAGMAFSDMTLLNCEGYKDDILARGGCGLEGVLSELDSHSRLAEITSPVDREWQLFRPDASNTLIVPGNRRYSLMRNKIIFTPDSNLTDMKIDNRNELNYLLLLNGINRLRDTSIKTLGIVSDLSKDGFEMLLGDRPSPDPKDPTMEKAGYLRALLNKTTSAGRPLVNLVIYTPTSGDHTLYQVMQSIASENRPNLIWLNDERSIRIRDGKKTPVTLPDEVAHLVYAGSDLVFVPLRQQSNALRLELAWKLGAIPIIPETNHATQTIIDPHENDFDQGNGFLMDRPDSRSFARTVMRALNYIACGGIIDVKMDKRTESSPDPDADRILEYIRLFQKAERIALHRRQR